MRQELITEIRLAAYAKDITGKVPGLTYDQKEEACIREAYDRAQKDFRVGKYRSKRDYNKI